MTTPKSASSLAPEDLSTRARRGELRADEQRALEHALATHVTLRVAHQVGRDFDQHLRVRSGDDELVLRASSRALEQPRARRPLRFALTAGLAAAVLVASAVAARGLWGLWKGPAKGGAESPADSARPALFRTPLAARRAERREEPEPLQAAPNGAGLHPRGTGIRARAAAPSVAGGVEASPAGGAESAASLFREAGAARRAGELALARARYAELQAKFPNSSEARVSRVSLGKLLLAAGRARDAEREFAAYLAQGEAALTEEALVGRAAALMQLGEIGEERRVWQEILRNHASSVYSARAAERLGVLEASSEPSSR